MDELSDDESAVFLLAAIGAVAGIVRWYLPIARARRPPARAPRIALAVAPIACVLILLAILRRAAAHEVTGDWRYVILFECLGIACGFAIVGLAAFLGVSARHDAIERDNPAAAIALCGAWLGATLAYAGANVGEGVTIWTTIGPAAVSLAGLLIAWVVCELVGHASEAITVDRDVAAGVRLAGALIAIGAILGRSVAGDYVSVDATLRDFTHLGWPALAIAILAGVVNRLVRPTFPSSPVARGVLPAVLYLVAAGAIAWR